MPRFNLTPAEYIADNGKLVRQFADEGAVRQDGTKPLFRCDCGQNVVWVKSARTGRNYLAECFPRQNNGFYYVKAQPHTWERHDARTAQRNVNIEAEQARDTERAEAIAELRQLQAAGVKLSSATQRLLDGWGA